MKFKANLDEKGYIESLEQTGTAEDTVEVNLEETRVHPLCCFKVVKNTAVYDAERYEEYIREQENRPTWQDRIESQVVYTAMVTDSLLEE